MEEKLRSKKKKNRSVFVVVLLHLSALVALRRFLPGFMWLGGFRVDGRTDMGGREEMI